MSKSDFWCLIANVSVWARLCLLPLLAAVAIGASPADAETFRSRQSGAWSSPETWEGGETPDAGAKVLVRDGHRVIYDVASATPIRWVHIAGTLSFARDRRTRLDVGLIWIAPEGADPSGAFDDHASHRAGGPANGEDGTVPALEVGTPNAPIPGEHTARIRLVHFDGMERDDLPAIVCRGGRLDLHGAPMERTWIKLGRPGRAGENRLWLEEAPQGWRVGDRIIVTGTRRQVIYKGTYTRSVRERPSTEERLIEGFSIYGNELRGSSATITLDRRLDHDHYAKGEFRAEVANLSRNVVIESADPEGVRGHVMILRHSRGSISYAEFRHLGKEGVLGRYPIHFHRVGSTMRGSSVIGASIWDSANHFITLHGTNYMVVRDCVGYQSIGHGFFLEDGTEVYNVLDRNLAVQALRGEPLPDQFLPYDNNDGAGFWWANSLNTFTRNVAVECDQHGYHFNVVVPTEGFDPERPVLQANGEVEKVDIRTLPFIRFEDNEAHTQRRFGLNLGGVGGHRGFGSGGESDYEAPHGDVNGVGPSSRHPFIIRDFRCWRTHWPFHAGSPCVFVKGMHIFDSEYGIWRSVMDRHEYEGLVMERITSSPIFYPQPTRRDPRSREFFSFLDPVDDRPPITVITHVRPLSGGGIEIRGTTTDNGTTARVLVNGEEARATRANFAQWRVVLRAPAGEQELVLRAHAEDEAGNVEQMPHERIVRPWELKRGK